MPSSACHKACGLVDDVSFLSSVMSAEAVFIKMIPTS